MAMTLSQAQTLLDAYLAAEQAVLSNQRYRIADRELQRASLDQIQKGRREMEAKVKQLTATSSGRRHTRYVVAGA